ncbi:uncharacterized protein LOC110835120 isoform X2 [Zootermopsis nevadensis]|uniref:uncharacterized protein LOC110835120 isoform X2 n=1 Tax=Zootermopsis nevadensis TaxID=136037 RepID=UPI000B8E23BB|nr:uncharacterized protein LOC110835120 isoform X2 [Zootermopsis nevadensis]
MAAPATCFALILMAVSCATIQWSKPITAADKRLSTESEDWVPVSSACPTCPKETQSKVVARQAASLFQPPPAYQPSAQSAYIEQTLSAQQREIHGHFNTQGLLPPLIQKPQQFYTQQSVPHQQYLPETGTLNQQLMPPQLSHQLPSGAQQSVPQLSHQLPSAAQQSVPQLSHQLPSGAQQSVPQLSHQLPSAAQQSVPQLSHQLPSGAQQSVPQLSHQLPSGAQQSVPQLSHQLPSAAQQSVPQLSHQLPSADQQLASPKFSHDRHHTRKPTPSATSLPAPQEEVQLLYVPLETLRQQHQAALLRQQQRLTQEPKPTTEHPSTTLEPYQPPLSVYMGPKEGHDVKISDVVKVLKEASTISVLEAVGPDSPSVFVGPSDLQTPTGYAKFELPYLSALGSNRIERKVGKPPFFVAPLSFKPPPGYSKIPFPAPHVGSVVIANVTENYLHEKDDARKAYSLPAELPPITPELPSLVNSLQDQRNVLLTPQRQGATNILQAVQQVGPDTSTERYTREKQPRRPHQDAEVTNKPARHRFQHPPAQNQETAVTTLESHDLDTVQRNPVTPTHAAQRAEISTYQPPYPRHEDRPEQSHYDIAPEDTPTSRPQTLVRNPTRYPQYHQAATQGKDADSHEHTRTTQTKPPSHQESSELTPKYLNSEEGSTKPRLHQNVVPVQQAAYNVPPGEDQYPRLEPTEPPKSIRPHENIPISQTQYPVPQADDQPKYTTALEGTRSRQPQFSDTYSVAPEYISEPQGQFPALEYDTSGDDALRQSKYAEPERIAPGNRSRLTSQEDIPHRQRQYPEYTILQEDIPQLEPQYPVSGDETAELLSKHQRPHKGILLRPEGENEQIYTTSRDEIPQHPVSATQSPQKQSKDKNLHEFPVLQPQHQNTRTPFVTTQPNLADEQEEISSGVTRYTVPSDRFQSRYPFPDSQVLTQPLLTTTAAPESTTLSRGRTRGRYRPSTFSTTTQAPRTRTSHARGRRPAARTSPEPVQAPPTAAAADKLSSFESSRQPSAKTQSHRFETQHKDRARTRSRGRSTTTTTTTASPEYSSDFYEEEQFALATSTQRSRTDTATENIFQFAPPHQQLTSSGQTDFTRRPSIEPLQGHSVQVTLDQFSAGQTPRSQTPGGSNSGTPLIYAHNTNRQVSLNQIPSGQDALGQFPDRNEAQAYVPAGQAAIVQTGNDELGQSQITIGQRSHSQIRSGTLDGASGHSQHYISSGHVDHGRIPTTPGVSSNQLPTGEARSNHFVGGHVTNGQTHGEGQVALPQTPGDYYVGQSVPSKDNEPFFPTSELSSTEATSQEQDGFLLHELPEPTEETTQRQYYAPGESKHRAPDVGPAHQTTIPPPTPDGKFRGRGDSEIVTSDRSVQQFDGEATQRPPLVRIRGRIRGRPRVIPQPVEQSATTATPELQPTTNAGRKNTNFLNRGSARKTLAPATTPTAETTTTTTLNDKVYTVRPSRRPQQAQTKLTKRGRIRRPTRPPTTTDVSTLTVTSGYGQNEVPDVFTTESIPGAGQFHAVLQPEYDLPQQYQYQSIQRHRQSEDQYLPDIRQPTPPQTEALGHLRVPDQMSLSSDNQPQYEADDLERGEESQWSTRTAALKAANAIQNAEKSSTTQIEAVTADTPVTTTDDAEAALLMLTASPDVRTSADPSTPGHSRRRGNWVRVRVTPQQQQDIFETAESQNLATVSAVNLIPGETVKQMTNSPGKQDVLQNNSLTFHGDSKDHASSKEKTEPSSTQDEFSFNSHSVPDGFSDDNATADGESTSHNDQNDSSKQGHPSSSTAINGHYKDSDSIRKHVAAHSSVEDETVKILQNDASGVTRPSADGYFSGENINSSDRTRNDNPSNEVISSGLLPPSGLRDTWNHEDPSEVVTTPVSVESDDATRNETTTTQQDSYTEPPLSSPEEDPARLNWGGYEDWWAKTYANHRPHYSDEHLKVPEETENLPDSISIWNMDSFREYDDGSKDTDDIATATNTSTSNDATVSPSEGLTSNHGKEDLSERHHSSKHSVKKANPLNLYNDKEVEIEDGKNEPAWDSIQVLTTTSPGTVTPITDSPVESNQSLNEPTSAHSDEEQTPPGNATELRVLPASDEFAGAPSSTESSLSSEDETDNPSHSETNQTLSRAEHNADTASEPDIKRTDTQALMTRILGTRTSTKISHETEICFRGRCIKTKTKDSDIDQFPTD